MNDKKNSFILTSRQVITPQGLEEVAIFVENGKISQVGSREDMAEGIPLRDYGDLVIMPGAIDAHVHINEPGRTEWEGFYTATGAAARGGLTTLVDMPLNSSPVTTSVENFRDKLAAASSQIWVDCGFYGGVIPGNSDNLEPLAQAGVLGFKAFMVHSGIDEFPHVTRGDLEEAMAVIAGLDHPLLVHAEMELEGAPTIEDPTSYTEYAASRPATWEVEAIALLIELCRQTNCPVHIVHLATEKALDMIKEARKEGLQLTAETCYHYLYFAAEEIKSGQTQFKCAPPIRKGRTGEHLWRALEGGHLDFVTSDHSPCPPELKALDSGNFEEAWGGIASLQWGVSLLWTRARQRGISVEKIPYWLAEKPAQFLGLEGKKGTIVPGADADFVIWDPEGTFTVEESGVHHRHKLTPYVGEKLYGKVHSTYLRGRIIFDGSELVGTPQGQILKNNFTS